MKGVLDRFEDNNLAVILIEEINKELNIPANNLPSNSKEGTWFLIEERQGEYHIVSIDAEKTRNQAQKSADLLERLRAKSSGSKFKRK